ncbi:hypothetical protein GMRT_aa001 [Giardia muris]|uniref:Uncharacterized protein n=1 Tax=Giardia muris TaxID=5742 RepID=A0A4Z1SSR4_GIAMU|nr:hypothetical protein GMRT_aa001 [Giardia muris]|eukprot:TNJ28035.1 hypothetical protein GMRT_aa001 [Giardia muris]
MTSFSHTLEPGLKRDWDDRNLRLAEESELDFGSLSAREVDTPDPLYEPQLQDQGEDDYAHEIPWASEYLEGSVSAYSLLYSINSGKFQAFCLTSSSHVSLDTDRSSSPGSAPWHPVDAQE